MTAKSEPLLTELRKMLFRYIGIAVIAVVLVLAAWLMWDTFSHRSNQANAPRIKVGMPFGSVVSLLGDPGGNYSSMIEYQYHIWKDETGWIRVWFKDGKVTKSDFLPKQLND
jgi:hypothetical protein